MLAWSWLMHGPTIVLRHVEALSCCNALISYLIIWITFKYISCRLVGISHWLLCNILDEIWSFELIIFKAIHICICHMSIIGNGNTHKVLIGCLSRPIDSNAPGIQLAMWLGQMKIFRTMLCTMCQNYYYIQYATMWLPLHTELSGGLSSLKVLFVCLFTWLDIIIYYCHHYRDNGSHLLSRCTTRYLNYFTCDVHLIWNYRKIVQ